MSFERRSRVGWLFTHAVRISQTCLWGQWQSACLLILLCPLLIECHTQHAPAKPTLHILQVPVSSIGGPTEMENIEGSVSNAKPGQQIVLYARSGVWWLQPFANNPFTRIHADATWKSSTHLGTEYAALLVDPGYRPAAQLSTLPDAGNGLAAVVVAKGRSGTRGVATLIDFSGYKWVARAAGSDHGGEPNSYDPANAWVDEKGYLHLRMQSHHGQWECAEVSLTGGLGYGTYTFVVKQSALPSPSAVLGFFTWDDTRSEGYHNEFDIELSRWGDPKNRNAQYVVQPFYIPENFVRFTVPDGVLTHVMRWQPGRASFETTRGSSTGASSTVISKHVFDSNIPAPAQETVHIDLYDFHHAENASNQPVEVVIEKFEYRP